MVHFEPYDVVVVPFPFTDSATTKRRPALVVSTKAFEVANGHVVLSMITSARHSRWAGDVPLRNWKSAGLPQPSLVRLKVFTLDVRFVLRRLGRLSAGDGARVRTSVRAHLDVAER